MTLTPQTAEWQYVSFSATWIPKGGRFVVEAEDSEVCVVVIAGRCSVRVGDVSWPEVGGRATPFDGAPHEVTCPWCGGDGRFHRGRDAQETLGEAETA